MRVCRHAWLHVIFMYWAIPENIHTIPQRAFSNLKSKGVVGGGGGWSLNYKSKGMGAYLRLESRRHGGGGGVDLEFLQETDKSVLLKTFIIWT